MQPAPVFLPGKLHGQRSMAGYTQSMALQRVGSNWAQTHSWIGTQTRVQVICYRGKEETHKLINKDFKYTFACK